jgi:membrane protein YdbS with pleckstrin-like domain
MEVASMNRLVLRGRMLIALAVGWVVLFAIAGAAFNGHSHVDNVVWPIVFIALFLVVAFEVIGLVALVRSRRSGAR